MAVAAAVARAETRRSAPARRTITARAGLWDRDARCRPGPSLLRQANVLIDVEDYEQAKALFERAMKVYTDKCGAESSGAPRALPPAQQVANAGRTKPL